MSAVTDLLDQLVAGSKSVDDVAEEFRTYAWPLGRPPAASGEEAFTRSLEDPEAPVEGSFFDVSNYHVSGKITDDQYDVLAQAAAEGMKGGAAEVADDEDDEEETTAPAPAADAAEEPPAGGVDPDDEDETQLFE